ncbi:MAG: transposase [Bacteroidales bacterium]|jgi:REP element-mobilizing transposase RayT|nr:transposase [Bacteroidales bacterium]
MELEDYYVGDGVQIVSPAREEKRFFKNVYHVMFRGAMRYNIFFRKEDYYRFLFYLNKSLTRYESNIYAFVLMTNHVHMLIKSDFINEVTISLIRSYCSYAYYKHDIGKNFIETPAKIVHKPELEWQLDALLYIINNPVVANLCKKPGGYPYSSYLLYTKCRTPLRQFIDIDSSLLFNNYHTLDRFNKVRLDKLRYQKDNSIFKNAKYLNEWSTDV